MTSSAQRPVVINSSNATTKRGCTEIQKRQNSVKESEFLCKFVRKSKSDSSTNFLFHFALRFQLNSIAFHSNDDDMFVVVSVNTG